MSGSRISSEEAVKAAREFLVQQGLAEVFLWLQGVSLAESKLSVTFSYQNKFDAERQGNHIVEVDAETGGLVGYKYPKKKEG